MNTRALERLLAILSFVLLGLVSVQAVPSGKVVVWGKTVMNPVPDDLHNVIQVEVGVNHILALKLDGTVVAWSINYLGNAAGQCNVPVGLTDVVDIAAAREYSVAIRKDGSAVFWGQASSVPAGFSDLMMIDAGDENIVGVKSDGTVISWGGYTDLVTNVPTGLAGIVDVKCGTNSAAVLLDTGQIVGWGFNDFGCVTLPEGIIGLADFDTDIARSIGLATSGHIHTWGMEGYIQNDAMPGSFNDPVAVAVGDQHYMVLESNGHLVVWGDNRYNELDVPAEVVDVIAIDARGHTSAAIVRESSESWGIYPMLPGSTFVDSSGWMGLLGVENAPWVWSTELRKYIFIQEDTVSTDGGWVYIPGQ